MEQLDAFEQFRDDKFLSLNTLSVHNVLEYFGQSRFFDTNSLNQQRRKGKSIPADADGVQYVLISANEAARSETPHPSDSVWNSPNHFGVFVIQRIRRCKGIETPCECYYIIGGTLYKAPSLACIIRCRLSTALRQFDSIVDDISEVSRWSLINGYHWGMLQAPKPKTLCEPPTTNVNKTSTSTTHHPQDSVAGKWDMRWRELRGESEVAQSGPRTSDSSTPLPSSCKSDSEEADMTDPRILYMRRTTPILYRIISETYGVVYNEREKFLAALDDVKREWDDELRELEAAVQYEEELLKSSV